MVMAALNLPSAMTCRFCCHYSTIVTTNKRELLLLNRRIGYNNSLPIIKCYSDSNSNSISTTISSSESTATPTNAPPPVRRRRRRYRKQYPGEKNGITEEMSGSDESISLNEDNGGGGETWQPSMEGFVRYLVDSKLVFDTVERIVDESSDVSYVYFRNTGLERSRGLSKDIEWFSQQDIVIPEPSNPGITYVSYLEELAEKSPPLFLCHFYNIYFSHIAGGQVIAKQVSKKLFEGRELKFYSWEGDSEELLRAVREKLNMLGEHWSRDEINKCLREATKAFRFLGQIVRLIIL